MNSFYLIVLPLILFGGYIGYKVGFFGQVVYAVKAAVSLTAAYFLFFLLNKFFLIDTGFLPVVFFSVLFILVFGTMLFIPARELKNNNNPRKYSINKISGAGSAILFLVVMLLLLQKNTGFFKIPVPVNSFIQHTTAGRLLSKTCDWVNEKEYILRVDTRVQASESKKNEKVKHGQIKLSYRSFNFRRRPDLESQMLQLINMERKKYRLNALMPDTALRNVARSHSADMCVRGYFDHDTPEGIDPFERMHSANISYHFAGENLAMSVSLERAHDNLMKSPGHRANILNRSYGRVGIGVIDTGIHGLMISQEFRD